MGWGENDRGVSFTFGAEVVTKFLHKHDFDLICRAHQVCKYFKNTSILLIYFVVLFLGCRRWLWVLCKASIGHFIFCTKLLWRVWQCWSNDVCWRNSNVLIPDFKGMMVKLISISWNLLQVIFFVLLIIFLN